jgi:hypothetical protein
MPIFATNTGTFSPLSIKGIHATGSVAEYLIENSLRFLDGNGTYLERTFDLPTLDDRRKWTWSAWVKPTKKNTTRQLFVGGPSDADRSIIRLTSSNTLEVEQYVGAFDYQYVTAATYPDIDGWYHFVVAVDTSLATEGDRIRVYVNGSEVTSFGTENHPSLNLDTKINSNVTHYIGRHAPSSTQYFEGYMADVQFIGGQQLTANDFGKSVSGSWIPKEYTGTYGIAGSGEDISVYTTLTPGQNDTAAYINSNPDSSAYPLVQHSGTDNTTIVVKFATTQTNVTSIKFRGGSYAAGGTYDFYINGVLRLENQTTNSNWNEDTITVNSCNINEIKIVGSDGFALGQLKFNDTLVSGTPAYASGSGVNSFHLNFKDGPGKDRIGHGSSSSRTKILPGVSFDGDDYLHIPYHPDLEMGTGDFSIEYYSFIQDGTPMQSYWRAGIRLCGDSNTEDGITIYHTSGASGDGTSVDGGISWINGSNANRLYALSELRGKMVHVLATRQSGVVRLFVDGVLQDSGNDTTNYNVKGASAIGVSRNTPRDNYYIGHISNVRVLKGSVPTDYQTTTTQKGNSVFTPPTTPLTTTSQGATASNVKLLCCQSETDPTEATVVPSGSGYTGSGNITVVGGSLETSGTDVGSILDGSLSTFAAIRGAGSFVELNFPEQQNGELQVNLTNGNDSSDDNVRVFIDGVEGTSFDVSSQVWYTIHNGNFTNVQLVHQGSTTASIYGFRIGTSGDIITNKCNITKINYPIVTTRGHTAWETKGTNALVAGGSVPAENIIWYTKDAEWHLHDNYLTASKAITGNYQDVISNNMVSGKVYSFSIQINGGDNNGGWWFGDSGSTSLSGTHPNQGRGTNSIGQRGGNNNLGAHGTFATANGVSAGDTNISGFSDTNPGTTVKLNWVVDRIFHKVWVKQDTSSTWIGGGDPTNGGSTPSFYLPADTDNSANNLFFGFIQYDDMEALEISPYDITRFVYGDIFIDSPSDKEIEGENNIGNYVTLDPAHAGSLVTVSNNNRTINVSASTGNASDMFIRSTFTRSSGQYYAECNADNRAVGIYDGTDYARVYSGGGQNTLGGTASGTALAYTIDDTIGIAVDYTNKNIYFYKNGTLMWQVTGWTNSSTTLSFGSGVNSSGSTSTETWNFGAQPFKHNPPSGYVGMTSA